MTGTDISEPITVVSPRTGEILTLDSSTEDLGGYLADVREYESLLKEAKGLVSAEILRRQDAEGVWTTRAGGYELKGSSPEPVEQYDELALRSALLGFVDEGVLTAEAVDRAIEPIVTYKARKAGLNALRKLGGRVADVVAEHTKLGEKRRYVSVSRAA